MAIAPSFFTITNPNLGIVSLQVTHIASNRILDASHNTLQTKKMFNMQIRAIICGEHIIKLADAPDFYHTVSPQVGYGSGSKPSKHYYGFEYDLRYIIQ